MEATPPRGRVSEPAAPAPAPAPKPAQVARLEPKPEPAPPPRPEPPKLPPAEEPPVADEDAGVLQRPPPDAPRIQVSFLVFTRAADRRMVWLSINEGSLVTLHEGDTTAGIEVAKILPDRVHLKYGGKLFLVRTRN